MEYQQKIIQQYNGWINLFELLYPSIQISFKHFIDIIPRLQPQYFTIASSSKCYPHNICLTVAVTQAQ